MVYMKIGNIDIPKNAIIYTSYSIHYNPFLNEKLFDFLLSFEPSALILFEPCYQLMPENSIYGLMCRNYININDYTKTIFSYSKESSLKYKRNFTYQANVIGENPFLPISILEIF